MPLQARQGGAERVLPPGAAPAAGGRASGSHGVLRLILQDALQGGHRRWVLPLAQAVGHLVAEQGRGVAQACGAAHTNGRDGSNTSWLAATGGGGGGGDTSIGRRASLQGHAAHCAQLLQGSGRVSAQHRRHAAAGTHPGAWRRGPPRQQCRAGRRGLGISAAATCWAPPAWPGAPEPRRCHAPQGQPW